ncbi:hypothetical protein [Mangrovimonas aestuarii]|uniref:hypothetical protein n=1 Tax=Mangrovimonas aestuarii TaxID=3018443 RepID=UPI0023793EC1|nr:hypothetical protein [Mangrovimonas aestuarii]
MRQLKLIWDFRGHASTKTAEHHAIHLEEYITIENVEKAFAGFETLSEMHAIAFMVVNETDMKKLRDSLKPHRGQVYTKNNI